MGFCFEFEDSTGPTSILNQMNDFRRDGSFCDVILTTEDGGEFEAHRLVLASVSEYFRAMFLCEMKESQQKCITIRAVDSRSLALLIDYAYSSKTKIDSSNVEAVLSAASMLQFIAVENACYNYLRKNINVPNSLGIWSLADLHGSKDLAELAEGFIRGNFVSVIKHTDFTTLTTSQLVRLLCHDKLNVPAESSVFEAVMLWVRYDIEVRSSLLSQLLEHIRFPLLTRKFLIDTVAKENLVMNDPVCRNYVLEAIDYHLIPERRDKTKSPRTIPREQSSRAVYIVGGEGNILFLTLSIDRFLTLITCCNIYLYWTKQCQSTHNIRNKMKQQNPLFQFVMNVSYTCKIFVSFLKINIT